MTSTSFTGTATKLQLTIVVVAIAMVLITVGMLVKTDGNVVVAVAPVIGIAVVWALARAPVNRTLILIFGVTLLAYDKGGTNPHAGKWDGPFTILGNFVFPNLPIKLNGIEMVLAFVLVLMLLRWLVGSKIDNPEEHRSGAANQARFERYHWPLCVRIWIVWGVLRGGNFQQMLWQTRQLM